MNYAKSFEISKIKIVDEPMVNLDLDFHLKPELDKSPTNMRKTIQKFSNSKRYLNHDKLLDLNKSVHMNKTLSLLPTSPSSKKSKGVERTKKSLKLNKHSAVSPNNLLRNLDDEVVI